MEGQSLFARPDQSVGQSGLLSFSRSQTLEGETAVALISLNYTVPYGPFGQYIPYTPHLHIISMPKQSENTSVTISPRSLENKSMTFENAVLCSPCYVHRHKYNFILEV